MGKVTSNVIKFVPHLLVKRAQERNLIAMKRVEAGEPGMGVFWAVPNNAGQPEVISYVMDLSKSEDYGGHTVPDQDHYSLWGSLQRMARRSGSRWDNVGDFEFDYWPRGRIKYNVEKDEFQLMADRQIVNNKALLREIMYQFALPTSKVEVSIDAHYRSLGDLKQTDEPYQQRYLVLQITYRDGETRTKEFASDRRLRRYLEQRYHADVNQWLGVKQGQPVEMDGHILQISERGQRPLEPAL